MCGGGSDPSDKIRKDEQRRETGMEDSSRKINSIFGIFDPNNFDATGNYTGTSGMYHGSPENSSTYPEYGGTGWVPNERRQSSREPTYIKDPNYTGPGSASYISEDPGSNPYLGLANDAYSNRQKIDKGYGDARNNIMNFFTHGLDEQLQDSAQEQTYDLARRGLLRGSEEFQAEAGRTERYDDKLLGLTNTADSSIDRLRTSDESSRLGLLQNIRAGMDRESAVAGATNSLTNNLDNATNAAHATQFSGLFNDLNQLYKAGLYTKGTQAGINNPYGGNTYAPGASGGSYSPRGI
jgi:hypothetical protein